MDHDLSSSHDSVTKLSEYVAEAASILGVSQGTVRAWADSGQLPLQRNPANGYRLFLKSDLEKFLRRIESSRTNRPSHKG
jgi:excisionase family DNA binding protein